MIDGTNNGSDFLEQSEFARNGPIGGLPQKSLSDLDRARALHALLASAERDIGARFKGNLREGTQFILKEATRSRAVSPRAYQLAWFVERTTRAAPPQ